MIYYATFFVAVAFAYISKKYKNSLQLLFYIISGGILVVLATIRTENVGIDVLVYVKKYFLIAQKTDNVLVYLKFIKAEPLYLIVTFFSTKLFGSLQAVFFFNELIIVGFTYAAIWSLKDKIQIDIAVMVFTLIFYAISLNISRQTMAVAIILYGFSKLLEEKTVKAMFFWIIAIGFHYSAIVCIFIYFIYKLDKYKLSKKIKACFLMLLIYFYMFYDQIFIFVVTNISFLPQRYIEWVYLYREYNISSCNLVLYGFCILLAICLMIRHKFMGDFWYYTVCLAVCGVFIAAKATFANRIFYYFQYLIIFMLSRKDIFPVKHTRSNIVVCNSMLGLLFVIHFFILQLYLNNAGIYPYESILFR